MPYERIPAIRSDIEIDLASEKEPEFLGHFKEGVKGPLDTHIRRDEHIDIALGAEVVTEDRSIEGKLRHPPAAAEFADRFLVDGYPHAFHSRPHRSGAPETATILATQGISTAAPRRGCS